MYSELIFMNCQSFHLSNTEKSRNVFECRKKVLCIMERERKRKKNKMSENTLEKSNIYNTTGYEDGQM